MTILTILKYTEELSLNYSCGLSALHAGTREVVWRAWIEECLGRGRRRVPASAYELMHLVVWQLPIRRGQEGKKVLYPGSPDLCLTLLFGSELWEMLTPFSSHLHFMTVSFVCQPG